MNFLRSRAEQLADYLRGCIERQELVEPLLGMRTWSQQLGVSRATLEQALWELKGEGLVSIRPRGVSLRSSRIKRSPGAARTVRLLYYARDFPESHLCEVWIPQFAERLLLHEIHFTVERCDDVRLRAIARDQQHPGELFALLSFSAAHQRLFCKSPHAALVLGDVGPDLSLPSVTVDQNGAVRHATHRLLRLGFDKLVLLMAPVNTPDLRRTNETFQRACATWPRQPVQARTVRMPLAVAPLLSASRRFAAALTERTGIVVLSPIPTGMIMTALMERGIRVSQQVELVVVMSSAIEVQLCPLPAHYPFPAERFVHALTDTVVHYFETRRLPHAPRTVGVELVTA